jgi:hypothetical protein
MGLIPDSRVDEQNSSGPESSGRVDAGFRRVSILSPSRKSMSPRTDLYAGFRSGSGQTSGPRQRS